MKTSLIALLLALGFGMSWCLAEEGQQQSKPEVSPNDQQPFSFWMTAKLKESQAIFAALTETDFQRIVESTNTLKTLSKLEGFVRKRNPEYRTQLRTFEFAVEEIQKQAEQENIEGVVLGFNQLTLSCVNCHKHLRDAENSSQ